MRPCPGGLAGAKAANCLSEASFCRRPEKPPGQGLPQHRVGSFVTFLAHQEK